MDEPASIYQNNSNGKNNQSIQVKLEYKDKNQQAIGAKVLIIADTLRSLFEYYPAKGFQSCSAVPSFFGVGERSTIDSLIVIWPSGKNSIYTQVATGQIHTIRYLESVLETEPLVSLPNQKVLLKPTNAFNFKHREIGVDFFDQERMLLAMPGHQGPGIAIGDVNKDGEDDVFIGGGKNQESVLYLTENGTYRAQYFFTDTRKSEAVAAKFFDSDLDGDLDLYVAHGGKGFSIYATELHDALYLMMGSETLRYQRINYLFHHLFLLEI